MGTQLSLLGFVILAIAIVVSLTVHETVHALVGYWLGDTTAADEGRISFNPLRHIDPFMTIALPLITYIAFRAPVLAAKPVPFRPDRVRYGEFGGALIAAAGPISNLLMATLGALILHIPGLNGYIGGAVYLFVTLNVGLFIFNLIPIPPLDGSRVLYAFAPEPVQQIMSQLEGVGLFIVFALALTGGLAGILTSLNQFILNILL